MALYCESFTLDYSHQARTLDPEYVGTNDSGWTIIGEIHADGLEWVNYFEATHPDFGWVRGDFEEVVEARSKRAYEHFVKHHPTSVWDYHDI